VRKNGRSQSHGTVLGVFAILLWSSTIAFSRSLSEALGPLTAGAAIFMLGGVLACIRLAIVSRGLQRVRHLPVAYLAGCGALFVIYMVSLYVAIGLASGRQQVLEVGLINYLWPGLTLVFAVPILKRRARASLVLGVLAGFAGIFLATAQNGVFSWQEPRSLSVSLVPYALALVAGVSWALYSNLSRRWAEDVEGGGVPLFLLSAGLVLAGLRMFFPEQSHWTSRSLLELLYMGIFPAMLGYTFWDEAMRRGRIILVASLSYFTPLLSTFIATAYLGVTAGWNLWAGCILVVIGAAICKLSVEEGPQ